MRTRKRLTVTLHYTHTACLHFIRPNLYALKCEHTLLHASALLECHHQGVLISVNFVPFELARNVKRSHSLTQTLTDTGTH
jgi:hypothetical protein